MLEDSRMDKKLNRSTLPQRAVVDIKKPQDVSLGKSFPKATHKREVSVSKPEPPRKNGSNGINAQKHKCYDKRPALRKINQRGGATVSQLEEFEELGIGINRHRKRNVNHLLNFQCKPRDSVDFVSFNNGRSSIPNTVRNLMATHKHKYNKEQFLQANCQFVVRANEDYTVYMADPDILVDWKLIEQIRVLSPEGINCPICLFPPVAGKITRCGHIYCWSCILHYLALTDKSWQKCPICFESIHQKDLKSVKVLDRGQYSVGEDIVFQLMRRERGSTIVMPVSETMIRTSDKLLAVTADDHTTIFSKLLLSNRQDVFKIIEDEEAELFAQQLEYRDCPELCFVQQAIELIMQRKNKLFEDIENNEKCEDLPETECTNSENETTYSSASEISNLNLSEKITYVCAFDDIREDGSHISRNINEDSGIEDTKQVLRHEVCTECIENINADTARADNNVNGNSSKIDMINNSSELSLNCATKINTGGTGDRQRYESMSSNDEQPDSMINVEDLELPVPPLSAPNKDFFFYQAIDGQQIFIHSLNARMLAMTYGGLEHAPLTIKGTILEKESGSMTEELRKRLRYLEHLPITCQFEVVEIELRPPLVTAESQTVFKDQIDQRCKQRLKRAREERKLEKKAIEFENNQYGIRSPPRRLRLDSRHHFPECGSDTPPDLSPRTRSPQNSTRMSSPQSSSFICSSSPPTSSLNSLSLSNSNTFAEKLKHSNNEGAWRKRVVHSEDDSLPPVAAGCSLSDAVEAALLKAKLEKEGGKTQQSKKKKKQKPIPLMSVGMVYTKR